MKKLTRETMIILTAIAITITLISVSSAKDALMSIEVKSVIEKLDKNGNPYKRVVFLQDAELNGIKYQRSTMLMVFSDQMDFVSDVVAGDELKCIVSIGEYRGRPSYTLQAVVQ